MHLAARQAQQVERHLAAGEKVQWSVSIEAYDIMVHARFLQRKNSGDTVTLVFREKRLGDPYSQDEGAMISGVFVAEVAGTLQISLDNSCVAPAFACTLGKLVGELFTAAGLVGQGSTASGCVRVRVGWHGRGARGAAGGRRQGADRISGKRRR